MRPRLAFLLALVPILALVGALPLVNRQQPLVLGLPFLLFWILAWVLATPLFLGIAYLIVRGSAFARPRSLNGSRRATADPPKPEGEGGP